MASIIYDNNNRPINLDLVIRKMQNAFGAISYIENVYGRGWIGREKRNRDKTFVLPYVYNESGEYVNLLPNDSVVGQMFFLPLDSEILIPSPTKFGSNANFQQNIRNTYKRPLDIIFWFNYSKINANNDYPFVENCVGEAREILSRFSGYVIEKISYDADNIFKEFSIKEVDRQNIMYPFGGFRISGYVYYLEDWDGTCIGGYPPLPPKYNLQEKTVDIFDNGEYITVPDYGYYGLSKVIANVDVQPELQDKTVEIIENGTYNVVADEGFDGLSSVVADVNVIGGNIKGDVRFIDYDGTILAAMSIEEAQTLTKYPRRPEHEYLTDDGWTHTLEQINATTAPLDVGAQYKTTDGKTHVWGTCTIVSGYDVPFCFVIEGTATFRFDWGDGTTTDVSESQNGLIHTFADGDWHVTIERISGDGTIQLGGGNGGDVFVGQNTISYQETPTKCFVGDFTSIGMYAFSSCHCIILVVIPSSIISIGASAFTSCFSLKSIVIPSNITLISSYMFSGCYSLTSVIIPSSVTIISSYSFYYCHSLTSLVIPSSVTNIRIYSFAACYSLVSYILLPIIPPFIEGRAFDFITSIAKIYVPDESVDAYKTATGWSNHANYIYPLSSKPIE